jgi:hypothetical protein
LNASRGAERANFEEVASRMCPLSPADLAEALAASLVDSVGPNRTLTLSR